VPDAYAASEIVAETVLMWQAMMRSKIKSANADTKYGGRK